MTQIVIDRDTEALLCTYLTGRLAAAGMPLPVSTQIPNPRPSEMVQIVRTGGVRASIISDRALITVDSFADSEARAWAVASMVRGLLRAAPVLLPEVVSVTEVGGPQNLPVASLPDAARYTQIFLVQTYSTTVEA